MVTCNHCKTLNFHTQRECINCHHDLLPGRSIGERIFVLLICLAIGSFGVYTLSYTIQWCDDEDCLPIYLVGVVPIYGLIYALEPIPPFKRYITRAKRHLRIDPDQAQADFTEAFNLAPAENKPAILEETRKMLAKIGRTADFNRDRNAAMESKRDSSEASRVSSPVGVDKTTYVTTPKTSMQEGLTTFVPSVRIGWCYKCRKTVILAEDLHCKLHPDVKVAYNRLVVSGGAQTEIRRIQAGYKRESRFAGTIFILLLPVPIILFIILYFLTNQ